MTYKQIVFKRPGVFIFLHYEKRRLHLLFYQIIQIVYFQLGNGELYFDNADLDIDRFAIDKCFHLQLAIANTYVETESEDPTASHSLVCIFLRIQVIVP